MKKVFCTVFTFLMIFGLSACGNMNMSDGFTNDSNTFNYILTLEAGEYRIHEINKWSDSSSDAVGAVTTCCNNRFWTAYQTAVLYKYAPEYLPDYVIVCGKEEK